ncbi:MAG: hypothetical protein H0X17_00095 [Deltaproteobacteria bacterium]|nr:hypothetical protein [Deltaproteobacteria bacterium]
MTTSVLPALYGASGTVFAVIALAFLRYWRTDRDRLFALFAAAFGCFSAGMVIRIVTQIDENQSFVFLPRLVGFVLIIIAIFDKNRRSAASRRA